MKTAEDRQNTLDNIKYSIESAERKMKTCLGVAFILGISGAVVLVLLLSNPSWILTDSMFYFYLPVIPLGIIALVCIIFLDRAFRYQEEVFALKAKYESISWYPFPE